MKPSVVVSEKYTFKEVYAEDTGTEVLHFVVALNIYRNGSSAV